MSEEAESSCKQRVEQYRQIYQQRLEEKESQARMEEDARRKHQNQIKHRKRVQAAGLGQQLSQFMGAMFSQGIQRIDRVDTTRETSSGNTSARTVSLASASEVTT